MKNFLSAIVSMFACLIGTAACGQDKFTSQDEKGFAETISDPQVQLVDVRTPAEYAAGHISGAVNIDVNSEGFRAAADTLDRSRKVAVYCRSGARSKKAAAALADMGFTVFELDGGILSWRGPVEK